MEKTNCCYLLSSTKPLENQMTMIKCSECGKDISDKATVCIGCGAPIHVLNNQTDTSNGSGKIDFDNFRAAFGKFSDQAATAVEGAICLGKNKATSAIESAISLGREAFQSQAEKDAAAIENLATQEFGASSEQTTESQLKCYKFKAALESTIDMKFAEVLKTKPEAEKYLSYVDAQILTASVRNIFKTVLSFTPPQMEAACRLSEAVLAPSAQEKQNLIKASIGLAGGTAGIGMVIGGVGAALGWGASIVTSITAAFVGSSIAGPVGWVIAGVGLAAIAGYFATSSNKQTDTERFLNVLKKASSKAVDAIWEKYGDELSKAADQGSSIS
jgi:hypothetical protein